MFSSDHENIYITPSLSEAVFCVPVISCQFILGVGPLLGYQSRGTWGHGPLKLPLFRGSFSQTQTPSQTSQRGGQEGAKVPFLKCNRILL